MLLADDFVGTCDRLRETRPRSRAIRLSEGARFNYQREGIPGVGSRLRLMDASVVAGTRNVSMLFDICRGPLFLVVIEWKGTAFSAV